MKRLVAVVLVLVFTVAGVLVTLFPRREPLPQDALVIDYSSVIAAAMEGEWASGVAALYDLNGDGVEELILQHTKAKPVDMDGQSHTAPVCGMSVYTMTKDGPVSVIDHKNLYIEVGGNGGYLTVIEQEGNPYLLVMTSGEDGAGCESVREERTVYKFEDHAATETETAVYRYTINDDGTIAFREAMINGKKVIQAEYEAWEADREALFVINPYTYNDPDLGNPEVHDLSWWAEYFKEE